MMKINYLGLQFANFQEIAVDITCLKYKEIIMSSQLTKTEQLHFLISQIIVIIYKGDYVLNGFIGSILIKHYFWGLKCGLYTKFGLDL